MNKINRRTMLLVGFALTTFFHLLVGLSAMLLPDGDVKPCFILLFVILFVFSMQATIGPLVWLLLAEIFPLKIRSFAMGVCVFCLWMANALVAFGFPPMVEAVGIAHVLLPLRRPRRPGPDLHLHDGPGNPRRLPGGVRGRDARRALLTPRPIQPEGIHPMSVLVAVPDSPEGVAALAAGVTEAELLGTDLIVINLALTAGHLLDPHGPR